MRKVLLVGFFTLVIVVASVFFISWFMQSAEMKTGLEQHIAKLNEKHTYITYERIDVSGFPTHISLSIVNPRFSGRVDELLKTIQIAAGEPVTQPLPEWHEDLALNGALTFTINAFSDHYTFGTSGEWQKAAQLAGKDITTITSQSSGNSLCSLKLARSAIFSNFWSYKITAENAGEFLKEIRELDCNVPAYSIVDSKTSGLLAASGETRIYFSHTPEGIYNTLRLFLKSVDAEVTTEGEKLIQTYIATISPDYPFPPLISIYGKQNLDIDFTTTLPLNTPESVNPNFDINLSNFSISNDVYTSKGYMRINNKTESENRTANITTRFESNYTEAYDLILKDAVRNFIKHVLSSDDRELQQVRSLFQNRSAEENYTLIEPAIPNIPSLGTQVFAINAAYTGSGNFMIGNYNLSEFAITMTPYGITGSGTGKTTGASPFPEATATFTCTNCMQLIDDVMRYAGRLVGVIQSFSSEPPPFFITPSLMEGTKKFFYVLSSSTPEEKKNGHFNYILASNVAGNVTISGRTIGDVMVMFNEYIGQEMPPAEATVPPEGWKVN